MFENNKIPSFINVLIKKTEDREILWERLPAYLEKNNNEHLRNYLIQKNKYIYSSRPNDPVPMPYSSYCTVINGGVITIFTFNTNQNIQVYVLCVQTSADSYISELSSFNNYQEELSTLVFYINNKLNNAEEYIDSIIGQNE